MPPLQALEKLDLQQNRFVARVELPKTLFESHRVGFLQCMMKPARVVNELRLRRSFGQPWIAGLGIGESVALPWSSHASR